MVWGVRIPVSPVGGFFISAMLTISIPYQANIVLVGVFAVSGVIVVADMKNLTPKS